MPNHIEEDALRLEVPEDLLSAESLDPLGKPQSETTAPNVTKLSYLAARPSLALSSFLFLPNRPIHLHERESDGMALRDL